MKIPQINRMLLFLMASLALVLQSYAMTTDTGYWVIPSQYLVLASSTSGNSQPNPWESRFSDGLLQTMEGNYSDAEKNYLDIAKTISDDSTRAKALLFLGELYQNYTEELDKAIPVFNEIIQKYSQSPFAESALFDLGVSHFHQKKYEQSYADFSTYSAKYPEGRFGDNVRFMASQSQSMLGNSTPRPTPIPSIIEPKGIPKIEGYSVRIAVMDKNGAVFVTSDSSYVIWSMDPVLKVKLANPDEVVKIRLSKNGWMVGDNEISTNRLWVVSNTETPLTAENKTYRGQLQLIRINGNIKVINVVSLEEYLYSVVPKEASDDWPMEALKAQAIAARTYVLSRMAVRTGNEFDVMNSEVDQVYGGFKSERKRTTEAVDATRGEILIYDGEPILSYFHSNSGGSTEDSYSVFGMRKPYLRAVSDPYSKNAPGYRWSLRITTAELQRRLIAKGINVGTVHNLAVVETSFTGRAKKIRIFHSKGTTEINASEFRWKVDSTMLRSTLFTVRKEGNSILFSGRGYGHGVGLSQWGCYNMAKKGKPFQEILSFYYPGTSLETL